MERLDARERIQNRAAPYRKQNLAFLNGFEAFEIDGQDPAAHVWAIWEMAERLSAHAQAAHDRVERYPVPLPYAIAEVLEGYGFPGAGRNAAHNSLVGDGFTCVRRNHRQGPRP